MGLLGDISNSINDALGAAQTVSQSVNGSAYSDQGFSVPPIPSPAGDGLPSSKVPSQRNAVTRRHIVHFFVPEVGVINMYVNPESIQYNYNKLINKERTKGGFVLQYWGEELPTLSLRGTTGSSGVEGLNVLYEIYRSEQISFDAIGVSLAANASISGFGDTINSLGQEIGGIGGDIFGEVTNGVLGLNPLTQSIIPRTPPTLAQLAFTMEIYYAGSVHRGYFQSMSVTESKDLVGGFTYQMEFVVTQRRGYRYNSMPWQRAANMGPSNNSIGGIPLSFDRSNNPSR